MTGWHVLGMFVAGFGIIVSVNVTLAVNAVRTFPGLEVASSYVASQSFEARRQAQDALGWEVRADYADGLLHLTLTDAQGAPVRAHDLSVVVARPTFAAEERPLLPSADGRISADLTPGLWRVDLKASAAGGKLFERSLRLEVPR
ncbi:FixH family protein [Roseivivax sp. CAU 1761]